MAGSLNGLSFLRQLTVPYWDVIFCQLTDLAAGKVLASDGCVLSSEFVRSPAATLFYVLHQLPADIADILSDYPEVLGTSFGPTEPSHGVPHHIDTDGSLIFAKA